MFFKFNFQGLFKTVLYIQVLFKPVRSLKTQVSLHAHQFSLIREVTACLHNMHSMVGGIIRFRLNINNSNTEALFVFCLFVLIFYVPVNKLSCHVGTGLPGLNQY